jgi:hypothetical protein
LRSRGGRELAVHALLAQASTTVSGDPDRLEQQLLAHAGWLLEALDERTEAVQADGTLHALLDLGDDKQTAIRLGVADQRDGVLRIPISWYADHLSFAFSSLEATFRPHD